jgi:hypothetical protein
MNNQSLWNLRRENVQHINIDSLVPKRLLMYLFHS